VILMNKSSGRVLSIDGSSTSDGAIAHQWQWVNSTAQLWDITPVS
jgi:Ricin-type beta-trefoil lectin domain-like